ncbi:LysE family translocator [Amantichitinum ursilacus]|uniref:Cysteine/O-acetylserine efflux protein n=1 Tax=Amantichitinum ursilacus TaxID=857265 RepID=A0A0N0GMK0_9NEIS|nr:LysE family translocator [Amantichitinum ursilacus]KPC51349.1 Cysteine/O-acetylserine efflux protein [Amantichitinum ursilacus]
MSVYVSMAAFALVASITPGPVNLVALGSAAQFGFAPAMRHVLGATLGFVLLLVLTGLGLHQLLNAVPWLARSIQWAGVAFLLWMAWRLASDDGQLSTRTQQRQPSLWYGALMQWLNPKAWVAALAGMSAYVADGDRALIWQFAVLYLVICYVSVGAWAYAGSYLRSYLQQPARIRRFNRVMALLLVGSAALLAA